MVYFYVLLLMSENASIFGISVCNVCKNLFRFNCYINVLYLDL